MRPRVALPRIAALGVALCLSSETAFALHNVYFTDPAGGMIYGMPDFAVGQKPAVVSGQLAIDAYDAAYLVANNIIVAPDSPRNTLVEIDIPDGTLELIYTLPAGWEVAAVGRGLSVSGVCMLAVDTDTLSLQIYQGTKSGDTWSFTATGDPFTNPNSQYSKTHIAQLTSAKYLVSSEEGLLLVEIGGSPQETFMTGMELDDLAVPGPSSRNLFMIYAPEGYPEFYDYDGNLAAPVPEEDSYLLGDSTYSLTSVLWASTSPNLAGIEGSRLLADDSPYAPGETPQVLFSAHTGDGSETNPIDLQKDIAAATSLFQSGLTTFDYYDEIKQEFNRLDTSAGTVTTRFTIEAGSGPGLGEILAMNTDVDGIIHVLSRRLADLAILEVDPATGDRTEVVTGLPRDLQPAISAETDGSYYLYRRVREDDGGTLVAKTALVQVTPGVSPDVYTLQQIVTEEQPGVPQDLMLTGGGEGYVLYPANAGLFFAISSTSGFAPYNGVFGFLDIQTRQAAKTTTGDIVLYDAMPPAIWDYDPTIDDLSQHPLPSGSGLPTDLTYPSDFVMAPDGDEYYVTCAISPNVYAINAATYEPSLFADGRPEGYEGEFWGAPSYSMPVICTGDYIQLPYGNFNYGITNVVMWMIY